MKLTDDEMAAVAISSGRAWEGRLPTVDDSTLESLLASVERGQVALLARDLVPEEGQEAQAPLAQVRAVAGNAPAVRMYVALEADLTMPVGLLAEIYALGAGEFLIDVSRPEGLHEVEVVSAEQAKTFVDNAVESAQTDGVDVDGAKLVLLTGQSEPVVHIIDATEIVRGVATPSESSFEIANLESTQGIDSGLLESLFA